ncbi:MAG: hypothetical protein QME32_08360, partial [Endomicrobiia bacterium]|nr:hypothetical protein [Endomicrobiia bacterium]
GVNNNLDKDVFTPYQVERGASDGARYAGYVNAFYTRDSRVGHGTALGIKYFDKSLLLNSNWNPYISSSLQAEYMQAGADFALEKPLGKAVLLSEVEVNYGRYSNTSGEIKLVGGVVKQSVSAGKYEFGLRYAAIIPDANMAYSTSTTGVRYKIVDAGIIHEITPSIVINHSKNIKVVMDAPIGIGTPVVMEKNNGPYDLMKQPDQTSYIRSGKVERQDIFTGRLMFQFVF